MSEKAIKRVQQNLQPALSRYIPKKVQDILKKEHGDKC